jgi:rhodanese-related sulfurtransferase
MTARRIDTATLPPAWKDVSPGEAQRLVASGSVEVIDVRTFEEYSGLGHIPGARLLPVDRIPAEHASLPRGEKPILLACEHGVRSEAAAAWLSHRGFRDLLNLEGGMSSWTGPREFGGT